MFQPSLENIKERVTKLKEKLTPTSSLADVITQDIEDDAFPSSDTPNIWTNAIYYSVCSMVPKNIAYTA